MASNLTHRIVTGGLVGAAALTLTLYDPITFLGLLVFVTALSAREWMHIGKHIHPHNGMSRGAFNIMFIAYIVPCVMSLIWLILQPGVGSYLVLGLFALVWTTDIAAYVSGRLIGGALIAPRISPSKTWAGLAGAILATAAIAMWLSHRAAITSLPLAALFGALLAVTAQMGDFFESWLKRRAGLKDSGALLPGHGGILDRIDGMVTAAPLYTAVIFFLASPR